MNNKKITEKDDLAECIECHNSTLNEKVEKNSFLDQRIKNKLKNKEKIETTPVIPRFRKLILLYSFIFVFFTVANITLVGWLTKSRPGPIQNLIPDVSQFQPTVPGSISQVYMEVLKWDE